jgi:hypothetical protein
MDSSQPFQNNQKKIPSVTFCVDVYCNLEYVPCFKQYKSIHVCKSEPAERSEETNQLTNAPPSCQKWSGQQYSAVANLTCQSAAKQESRLDSTANHEPAPTMANSLQGGLGVTSALKTENVFDDHHMMKKGTDDHRTEALCPDRLVHCTVCKLMKPKEKFSLKQLNRPQTAQSRYCERCEDKGIMQYLFGKEAKLITIQTIAKDTSTGNSQHCYLATACPHELLPPDFPNELVLDGYMREDWILSRDEPSVRNNMWFTVTLHLVGGGTLAFLDELQEHKKSAYATFHLPSGRTGLFVIPFVQLSPNNNRQNYERVHPRGILVHCQCRL